MTQRGDARWSPDSADHPEYLAYSRDVQLDRSTTSAKEEETWANDPAKRGDLGDLSPDDVSTRGLGDFMLDNEWLGSERCAPRPVAAGLQQGPPGSVPLFRPRFTRPRVLELGVGLPPGGAPRVALGLERISNDAPHLEPEITERLEARSRAWACAADTPSPGTPLTPQFLRRTAHPAEAEEERDNRRACVGRGRCDHEQLASPSDEAMRAARYCLCEEDLLPDAFVDFMKRDQGEQRPLSPPGVIRRRSFGRE